MSTQITTAMVNQYRSNLEILTQQKGSRLAGTMRQESQNGEFEFYDRIGATEAQEVVGRHQDTPLNNTPHDRRRVGLRDFDWADMIDKPDKIRLLVDPQSPYAVNAAWAMGRKKDDVIIEAFFGNAYSGKTGATTVAFPTATQQIAVNYVESGTPANSNLSIGKLRRADEILKAADIDPDEPRYCGVTANQLHALLATTEVTNQDYAAVKALVEGRVDSFMGFKFIHTERFLTNASNYRRVPVWTQTGMLVASGADIMVDIGPRRDKRNATQVYVTMSMEATRMEEIKVVEILCDETVFP